MISWKEFFDVKIDENNVALPGTIQNIGLIRDSLVVLSLHIVALIAGTLTVMNKKDILS